MSYAALFPGQGSQAVGMGADLFEARPDLLGERADEILGWSLREMCLNGPEDKLTRTEHTQPALFALSYALWDEFARVMATQPAAAAGHSLGEYTALAAAGVFAYHDGLSLVSERGRAMAAAADLVPTGMAAVIGADEETVSRLVAANRARGGRMSVANFNAPGQIVVAGAVEDIEWLADNARAHGVRRAIPLNVAGAFHTEFMEPARERVASALSRVGLREPAFKVWSNTTAEEHESGTIAETLARQMVSPVRFSDSLRSMARGGTGVFVHVGPGDVTAGMARRTVDGAEVLTVNRLDDIDEVVASLSTMA
ncbi:MAG: ACP S-malonyltransferase [Acidimicrobiia bacterium]|nr:ACP S-malonyltransferase [Acidimicrobiia bacterium]